VASEAIGVTWTADSRPMPPLAALRVAWGRGEQHRRGVAEWDKRLPGGQWSVDLDGPEGLGVHQGGHSQAAPAPILARLDRPLPLLDAATNVTAWDLT
jgi:hypothetical protein